VHSSVAFEPLSRRWLPRFNLEVTSVQTIEPAGRDRSRLKTGIAVLLVAGIAVGTWAAFIREPSRHDVNGLSCVSQSFSQTAVDFAGIPSWPSAEEALDYAFELDKTLPTDGWQVTLKAGQATWERHDDDGHLVGRSIHQRVGTGWGFAMPDVCEETRTDPPVG
jgi:hypothetical protein